LNIALSQTILKLTEFVGRKIYITKHYFIFYQQYKYRLCISTFLLHGICRIECTPTTKALSASVGQILISGWTDGCTLHCNARIRLLGMVFDVTNEIIRRGTPVTSAINNCDLYQCP
jgi:hypothetical protein